jgi:hypothetical protein
VEAEVVKAALKFFIIGVFFWGMSGGVSLAALIVFSKLSVAEETLAKGNTLQILIKSTQQTKLFDLPLPERLRNSEIDNFETQSSSLHHQMLEMDLTRQYFSFFAKTKLMSDARRIPPLQQEVLRLQRTSEEILFNLHVASLKCFLKSQNDVCDNEEAIGLYRAILRARIFENEVNDANYSVFMRFYDENEVSAKRAMKFPPRLSLMSPGMRGQQGVGAQCIPAGKTLEKLDYEFIDCRSLNESVSCQLLRFSDRHVKRGMRC